MQKPNVIWVVEFRWGGSPSKATAEQLTWSPIFPTASATRAEARKQMEVAKRDHWDEWRYRVVKYTPDHP